MFIDWSYLLFGPATSNKNVVYKGPELVRFDNEQSNSREARFRLKLIPIFRDARSMFVR